MGHGRVAGFGTFKGSLPTPLDQSAFFSYLRLACRLSRCHRMRSNRFQFLAFLSPVYVVALWIASSITSSDGFGVFLAGLVLWLVAGVLAARHRPKPAFIACLLMTMTALFVLSLEGVLRAYPGILQGKVANVAYGRYHTDAGGIYYRDPWLGNAMHPSMNRQLYWNGHWWTHQTNSFGYRGAAAPEASAVFLGDSMIYGHGVEEDATVASQYAALASESAANLGQQGICGLQELAIFDRYLELQSPRVVFLCCHPNDIPEAMMWYDREDLERFVSEPADNVRLPMVREKYWPKSGDGVVQFWNRRVALPLHASGAIKALLKYGRSPVDDRTSGVAAAERFLPSEKELHRDFHPEAPGVSAEEELGWRVQRVVLELLAHRCRQSGATLVVFDIGYPFRHSEAIEKMAGSVGALYAPVGRRVLERAQAGEELYLANDGHWNAAGCRAVAEELVGFLAIPGESSQNVIRRRLAH